MSLVTTFVAGCAATYDYSVVFKNNGATPIRCRAQSTGFNYPVISMQTNASASIGGPFEGSLEDVWTLEWSELGGTPQKTTIDLRNQVPARFRGSVEFVFNGTNATYRLNSKWGSLKK